MHRTALLALVSIGLFALGCGSAVESDAGSGGGGTGGSTASPSSTSPSSTSSSSTSSGDETPTPPECGSETCDPGESCYACPLGGGVPEPGTGFVCSGTPVGTLDGTHPCSLAWAAAACEQPSDEACNCAACEGLCEQACNFSPDWVCHDPGEPTADEFSCGGWANCRLGRQACVNVSPLGDGCTDHFCADLPEACVDDATCECIAQFTDGADFPTSCSDDAGLSLGYQGYAYDPPWDAPWCGSETCEGAEGCYSCVTDGGMSDPYFVCAEGNPSAPGIQSCSVQWSPPPVE